MQLKTSPTLQSIASILKQRGWTLSTAESCTGGGLGAALTTISGSSEWYQGGLISYSNASKQRLLNVDSQLIDQYGAVSEPVVRAMCWSAQQQLASEVAIAVTGVAGPDGGSAAKPVGTVWIGWQILELQTVQKFLFDGVREQVRSQSIDESLVGLLQRLQQFEHQN